MCVTADEGVCASVVALDGVRSASSDECGEVRCSIDSVRCSVVRV